jgi:peptidoglycan/LPS O-acetylase OafA/YrhL
VPALDGARAFAITLVLLYHAFDWPPGGFLGVHVFFVLSGFLITALLVQEWNEKGAISLGHFYRRRALRLLPALAALLVTYSLIQVVRRVAFNPSLELGTALKGVLVSAFYVSNVFQAAGYVVATPLIHLWSLATEEQFYLLWPFVLLVCLRLGIRPRGLELFLIASIALVVANRAFWALSGARTERLYFAPDTSFDAILIGCLLGIWFAMRRTPRPLRSRSLVRWAAFPAGLFVLATVVLSRNDDRDFYLVLMLPFLAATGLLVLLVSFWDAGSLLARVLETPPLVFVGKISYSLYLWHLLALGAIRSTAGPVAGLALAFLVATASYFFIELPFLRVKARNRAELERRPPERPPAVLPRQREQPAVGAR